MMKHLFLYSLFVFLFSSTYSQQVSIIPQPMSVKMAKGNFRLQPITKIYYDKGNIDLKAIGEKLSDKIKEATGLHISVQEGAGISSKNTISLSLGNVPDSLGNEGYTLSVTPVNIVIKANKPAGVFYGTETILQLLPLNQTGSSVSPLIRTVEIVDKPRFGWRGLMLDVGRYFYSPDFIKEFIDDLAMHKMNTFHWHLTEDHGWRIEIKKYPLLMEDAAWRSGTQIGKSKEQINRNPHGGYYTQQQIRDIVAYAAARYVTIIPEIEMPGHALAALSAYPELSCTGGPITIPLNWGIQKDIFCAGNEKTFEFLEGVLTEVADLFPGPVIHIGGDEAPKDRWKACHKCQARMKAENLKDEHELQSYFIKRIENFLLTKNKKIIGWDEILEGGLAPNAMVMSWRGEAGGIAAAKQHHDVIMTPNTYTYLDYYQGEPYNEPVAIGGLLTLEKVYSYEPFTAGLTSEESKYIKGVQGAVWSEYIHSPEKVEYMAFPRAAAVAEIGWSKREDKNWESFKRRMEDQYKRYELAAINYSKSAYNVWITDSVDSLENKAVVTLETNSSNPEIRYTFDGTEPKPESRVYKIPVIIKLPGTIKAATYRNGNRISKVSSRSFFIKTK